MGKAIGIGGVFIHFHGESVKLFDFYQKYLGMEFSAYGSGFLSGEQLMVLTFKRDAESTMPLINLRVDHIDEIINHLKKDGIEIVSDIETYDYGKFAQFKDPFGNVVELWEADRLHYIQMVEKEIENYKKEHKPMIEK
ncbi:MAG: VOC family protein [Acholeplasmataceae bacterium]|jgi:predicted enzyme related to lactoylglutathione lyase|nr:VOC family protein [Acholeplasmataceae bacterium]